MSISLPLVIDIDEQNKILQVFLPVPPDGLTYRESVLNEFTEGFLSTAPVEWKVTFFVDKVEI